MSSTINDQRYNLVVQVERTRMRQVELDGPTGEKQIAGGRFTKDGVETPWYSRCQQSVTIHSSPEAGGGCIEAFNGEIKAGAQLQMWDCNDTPPQIFAFDVGTLALPRRDEPALAALFRLELDLRKRPWTATGTTLDISTWLPPTPSFAR